jgi:hypothetical protein
MLRKFLFATVALAGVGLIGMDTSTADAARWRRPYRQGYYYAPHSYYYAPPRVYRPRYYYRPYYYSYPGYYYGYPGNYGYYGYPGYYYGGVGIATPNWGFYVR